MAEVRFFVPGRPAPKGSHKHVGRGRMAPASKYQKPWQQAVEQKTAVKIHRVLKPPYAVECVFVMARPSKPRWEWPSQTDGDKLLRCTVDGLVGGGALVDDRHVVDQRAVKRFAVEGEQQGCWVTIRNGLAPGSARP